MSTNDQYLTMVLARFNLDLQTNDMPLRRIHHETGTWTLLFVLVIKKISSFLTESSFL
jgi:hypothetical protein